LEFGWNEPIITPDENARRHGRPGVEGAPLGEHGLGLTWLTLGPGCLDYGLWHVMKEFDQWIKGASAGRPSRLFCWRLASSCRAFVSSAARPTRQTLYACRADGDCRN
jgi:hypothetical protein